ncbi:hypothetical protein EOL96_03440 [Candidatus Saccharibacteria bacterium]|nr:hypothetical protein [Candidatus Saccharibacteria bacterium]
MFKRRTTRKNLGQDSRVSAAREALSLNHDEDTGLEACFKDLSNDPILEQVPEHEREEALGNTLELYREARDKVAPVIAGFADALLTEAGGSQIIFAARDGIGALEASRVLVERFPEYYSETNQDNLIYAFLTRKVVRNSSLDQLRSYLAQCGVKSLDEPVYLADIGMYGTILHDMQQILPNVQPRYLISRNHRVPGYADNEQDVRLQSLSSIIGNSAIHFLEDTFSGITSSASQLIEYPDLTIKPNIKTDAYPPSELLKRKYALRAIVDYTVSLSRPPQQANKHEQLTVLDEFLANAENYRHLMVPHIR